MKHIVKRITTALFSLSITALSAAQKVVYAQLENPVIGELGSAENVQRAEDGSLFARYFVSLWSSVISIGAIAVLVLFIWGSFEWMSAGGDSAKTDKARQRITNALLGLFILVSTFVIINFISALFFGENFNILQLRFPNAESGL